MANRVLVFRSENRNKGNRTVKELMANDPVGFGTIEQALRHLTDGSPDPYFTPRECSRKWENLHRDALSTEDFHSSQLTDTAYAAYAARQVVGYLKNAFYADAPEGRRYVFTTKGKYTAILRRDWGLMESQLEQQLPVGAAFRSTIAKRYTENPVLPDAGSRTVVTTFTMPSTWCSSLSVVRKARSSVTWRTPQYVRKKPTRKPATGSRGKPSIRLRRGKQSTSFDDASLTQHRNSSSATEPSNAG